MTPATAQPSSESVVQDEAQSGTEKDAMHSFICGNLNFILAPIGESVRDLEDDVVVLKTDLARERARNDLLEATKEDHAPKIVELFDRVSANESRLKKAEEDMALLRREKDRLEADHEGTKAALGRAEANLKAADEQAEVLGLDLKALKASLLRMEFGLQDTNISLGATKEHLAELKDFCEGLNGRHMDMVQSFKDLGEAGAETDRAVQKLQGDFADLKEALEGSERKLCARASELDNKMVESAKVATKRLDEMFSDMIRLKGLRAAQDAADKRIKQLEDNAMTASDERDSLVNELKMTQQDMTGLNKDLAVQKSRFEEYRQANEEGIRRSSQAMADFSQEQQRHARAILQLELNTGDLHTAQVMTQRTLEDVKKDVRKLQEWRTEEAIVKIDKNTQGVQMNQGEIWKLNIELGISKDDIQKLKDELAAANIVVAKLGSRYDTCSSQLQGISKGFHATAQNVLSGVDGHIKPKVKQSSEQGRLERTLPPLASVEGDATSGLGLQSRGSPAGHNTGFLSARGAAS